MKRLLLILLVLLALAVPSSAFAAIALDSAGGAISRFNSVSTITQAFNNVAGTYLVVTFVCNLDAPSVTSVKYANVAMTQLAAVTNGTGGEGRFIYGLASPATGNNNVVVTLGGTYTCDFGVDSYTGIVGTDGTFTSTNATGGGSTATETITTTKDNDWMVASVGLQRTATASTNSTFRSGNTGGGALFDNNGPIHPAGSYSMSQTESTTGSAFTSAAVAFYPVQPATPAPPQVIITGDW